MNLTLGKYAPDLCTYYAFRRGLCTTIWSISRTRTWIMGAAFLSFFLQVRLWTKLTQEWPVRLEKEKYRNIVVRSSSSSSFDVIYSFLPSWDCLMMAKEKGNKWFYRSNFLVIYPHSFSSHLLSIARKKQGWKEDYFLLFESRTTSKLLNFK